MARSDWLRTFVAIYRCGSVTDGAQLRALSQPAASQQLASLEQAVGASLFVRGPAGVAPTERGRALYAEVSSALDQLEVILEELEDARRPHRQAAIRIGSSAEYFSAELLPRVANSDINLVAHFGNDETMLEELEHGELDLAITSRTPPRRSVASLPVGEKRFVLVAPKGHAPHTPFGSPVSLGQWLADQPWVAYSLELPITRRLWQMHLGRPFSARLRLVAPDLRAVVEAVAQGLGCSLLPQFACAELLRQGQIVELYPVTELVAPESWYVCFRQGDAARSSIAQLLRLLMASASEV